jgi:phage-related protein
MDRRIQGGLEGFASAVLHVFQKKAKHGISTPKVDMNLIKDRLKAARQAAKELS